MGFEVLLGNERLKDNLTAALRSGRLSHFYLISGPEGSGKKTLARLLAAAMVCTSPNKPCGACNACRKVLNNTHPDFITVTDPEHKAVAVRIVRQVREEMFIRPNEADKKIYLFPQELNTEGQNALLKIFEEPPPYGVFLLLADNPQKVLPTVRSRCVELSLTALPVPLLKNQLLQAFPQAQPQDVEAAIARSGGWLGQAQMLMEEGAALSPQTEGFADAYSRRNSLALLQILGPMEKWKRDALLTELYAWLELLQMALVCRSGMPATSSLARSVSTCRSSPELMTAIGHLQKAIEYTQGNVSPGAVCGWLEWVLR